MSTAGQLRKAHARIAHLMASAEDAAAAVESAFEAANGGRDE